MVPLEEIFCSIDDFCKHFTSESTHYFLDTGAKTRPRSCQMSLSEIMTIEVLFHFSHYRTFKDFYKDCILGSLKTSFPKALSYTRFVEIKQFALMPLAVFIQGLKGQETGVYYVDSTKIDVCHNLRIYRHKVIKDFAKRGKTSTSCFFGFKVHLIFNNKGEIMSFQISSGNTDDRKPVDSISKNLKGWILGDRGYISKKLALSLQNRGLELITTLKHNMKKQLITPLKKYLLSKRGMVETIIDQLKNMLHIQHTRHRSVINFQVNLLAGLVAYVFKPNKVSIAIKTLPSDRAISSN